MIRSVVPLLARSQSIQVKTVYVSTRNQWLRIPCHTIHDRIISNSCHVRAYNVNAPSVHHKICVTTGPTLGQYYSIAYQKKVSGPPNPWQIYCAVNSCDPNWEYGIFVAGVHLYTLETKKNT